MIRRIGLVLLLSGCAAPEKVESAGDAIDVGLTSRPLQILEFDQRPPWFRDVSSSPTQFFPEFEVIELTAVGEHRAVVLTTVGYAAVDAKQGVFASLSGVGLTDRLGLAKGDGVLHLRSNGVLERHDRLEDLASKDGGSPVRLGAWPRWRAFDASQQCVVVAADDRVSLSLNGGGSFQTSVPAKGRMVNGVWCRHDGLVVAEVAHSRGPRLMISTDSGRSWDESRGGPRRIFRDGAFIWGEASPCPLVLASDGRAWTPTPRERLPDRNQWLRFLELAKTVPRSAAFTPYGSTSPGIPSEGPPSAAADPCMNDGSGKPGTESSVLALLDPTRGNLPTPTEKWLTADCKGLACLQLGKRHRRHRPTKVFGFLARPLMKASPRIGVADLERGTLTIHEAPAGCVPEFAASGPGILILLCRGRRDVAMFASSDAETWLLEGSMELASGADTHLVWASDGTLMIGGLCSETEEAWEGQAPCSRRVLRLPGPLGAPGLWRKLSGAGDVVAARVLTGGRALLVGKHRSSPQAMSLWIDEIGSGRRLVARATTIPGDLRDLWTSDGKLVFSVADGQKLRELVLTVGGQLVEQAPSDSSGPTGP